jgi:hypothetical protein
MTAAGLVVAARAALEAVADPVAATKMAGYMRGIAPFFGVPAPIRRQAVKPLGVPAAALIAEAAVTFYEQPEREFAYVANDWLQVVAQRLQKRTLQACLVSSRLWRRPRRGGTPWMVSSQVPAILPLGSPCAGTTWNGGLMTPTSGSAGLRSFTKSALEHLPTLVGLSGFVLRAAMIVSSSSARQSAGRYATWRGETRVGSTTSLRNTPERSVH